jgi:multidrug resistance efflux pump
MTRAAKITAAIALVIFTWYLFADRITPFTANARVKAVVVPIVPQVSGYVAGVSVTNSQLVDAGSPLAVIDPVDYQIKVDKARADLETATSQVGAGSAEVEIAQSAVARARTDLENVQVQSDRVFALEKKGLVAVARGDSARSSLAAAQSSLAGAEADLVRAQEDLGAEGSDNPRVRAAVAALSEAELDLERSQLYAPSRGAVLDLNIDEGTYATAGKALMTFVSAEEVWVEAYMTENNLGRVSVGDPAEVVLDIHPGRVLNGIVASFGGGASTGSETKPGELPKPPKASGWMRDPQRFPLRIRLPDYVGGDLDDDVLFQVNGQADIIVYTSGNLVLNTIGALWIRAMAWLSYAY